MTAKKTTPRTPPAVGTVVRHTQWKGGEFHGTVVRVEPDALFVQWHGTCVGSDVAMAGWADVLEVTDLPNPENNGLRMLVFDARSWRPIRKTRRPIRKTN